ncbi:hypothetical protein [Rossellomorea aquimaris]|uniref:hypothetical protein n=1 Tax=Rossellomorea aquimaris TaxID=189382 RepID=UPI0011E8B0C1|nr:hypothetical protein [Rossellomorea aquimaris]TYS91886.1 hypothetical protein FZC88_07065 [Rossellomorea aquimaris]
MDNETLKKFSLELKDLMKKYNMQSIRAGGENFIIHYDNEDDKINLIEGKYNFYKAQLALINGGKID